MKLTVTLPWPDKKLSPNARTHWRSAARVKAEASDGAYWLTRQAMGAQFGPATTKISHDGASDIILDQVACPPNKAQRDRDNLDSSLKAARDGMAKALGVNDRFFRPTGIQWGEVRRNGEIVITITFPVAP